MKRLALISAMIVQLAFVAPALADGKAEVKAAFQSWVTLLETGNAEAIVRLYAKDAVLLSTIADEPMTTPEERLAYFKIISQLPELTVHVNEMYVRMLHNNAAVVSGLYTFQYKNNGKMAYVPARFSFVYEIDNDQWLIVDQHSSQMPSAK
jgi:uncharacterized protein (TIGR02246 family)